MSLARVFCSWSIAAVLLLLSIAFSNSAESETTLDPVVTTDENGTEVSNSTSNITLTGNPQIDYIHDPNLPRELNGYNLSDYPFYHRVPAKINFSCDGRKEGFYANVEHKCQIYHHCLFGSRFDFICANYTAFDQRTFICQFVSDVDCPNSHNYYHRNKDLYVTKTTTTIAPVYNIGIYDRKRPPKRNKFRRPAAGDTESDAQQPQEQSTQAPAVEAGDSAPAPPPKRNPEADYADDDDYSDEDEYRRPVRPRRRKCRYGRRRGRRCRRYRPRPAAYYSYREDYDDYEEDYDDYYDNDYDERGRKKGPKRLKGGRNTIPAATSQVTSTSSSETPPPTTTTTTTTEAPAQTSTSTESASGPLDSESIAVLQKQRGELLTKTRRPFVRPSSLRSRLNAKTSTSTTTTSTTTTSTTTERAKPSTSSSTTSTTTEVPQYIYDYEYYEDDTSVDASSTTTTTTAKPFSRGKPNRGGNSAATAAAAAVLEKQRVQPSIQVRVTEDAGTNTNTIRRRDNSNVQTPTRVAALPSTAAPSTTTQKPVVVTQAPVRPARFWQRKSTVKSLSAPVPSTTTTTAAPFYQDYQDYEDAADPQPSAPAAPPTSQSSSFQPLLTPTHQYGTSPAVSNLGQRQSYANPAPTAPQLPVTTSRGHGSGNSLSSSTYARPNKHYAMQQYSQTSSSSSSNNNDANYNSNSYHRQRNPPSSVAKPEFISLVDEDYNNPYVSPVAAAPTSPTSTRLHGGGGGGGGGGSGYHQHPIRFFEQQPQHPFLFGAASEYNSPQFAFPPRNYPSPSNFQPYDHSNRRFSAHVF